MSVTPVIKNKKASFEYHFLDEFEAGIVLAGTEVKSLRDGQASINEAYCVIRNGELYILNMHIAGYKLGTCNNHEPRRERKLLLNRREIRKITVSISEKGLTVIPTRLFFNDKGLVKLKIAIAKGKKLYDKRETLKLKDQNRDFSRREHTSD
ncbi:MAG TPA: SsrA-binding protein SmpB [Bacteroidales bacterium]|nr:SsrA-binding protein SmpB [Bacteroidales bacterium]